VYLVKGMLYCVLRGKRTKLEARNSDDEDSIGETGEIRTRQHDGRPRSSQGKGAESAAVVWPAGTRKMSRSKAVRLQRKAEHA
jgi:hypothetical protein